MYFKASALFQYLPNPMRSSAGSCLRFLLCDTPGVDETMGLESSEANLLLDGHVPDFYQVGHAKRIVNIVHKHVQHVRLTILSLQSAKYKI